MTNPNTPVIVGAAQVLNRAQSVDDAVEPLQMMLEAVERAQADTGVGDLLRQVQSVRVVRGMWRYANPARHIAERLGAPGAQTVGTLFGGNQNQVVVNRTAESILAGELDLVLITGAENGNSTGKARKVGITIPLTATPGEYDLIIGETQKPEHHDFEIAKGIRTAIQVYPMYDNAIRQHRGETMAGHLERVSGLWSRFNDVAQGNPNAWIREDLSAETIRTPSATNRAISYPYTKLMNANMSVNMGAALLDLGRTQEAMEHLRRAERLNPGSLRPDIALATHYQRAGDWQQAVATLRRARRKQPEDIPTAGNLAWLLVTAPEPVRNPEEAVRLAQWAASMTMSRDPQTLMVLAEAHVLSGDTTKGIEATLRARRAAEAAGASGLVGQFDRRLQELRAANAGRRPPAPARRP